MMPISLGQTPRPTICRVTESTCTNSTTLPDNKLKKNWKNCIKIAAVFNWSFGAWIVPGKWSNDTLLLAVFDILEHNRHFWIRQYWRKARNVELGFRHTRIQIYHTAKQSKNFQENKAKVRDFKRCFLCRRRARRRCLEWRGENGSLSWALSRNSRRNRRLRLFDRAPFERADPWRTNSDSAWPWQTRCFLNNFALEWSQLQTSAFA